MDKRWIMYLNEFHATRDYYACHDYLEDWWFDIGNPKNHMLVAFIQLAVGLYHWRRGSHKPANGLFVKAKDKFVLNADQFSDYNIDLKELLEVTNQLITDSENQHDFYDVNLPMTKQLESEVKKYSALQGSVLYSPSNLDDKDLVDRHLLKHK